MEFAKKVVLQKLDFPLIQRYYFKSDKSIRILKEFPLIWYIVGFCECNFRGVFLSFNEVLFHVLEGFGPNNVFNTTPTKNKTTNDMANVSDNQPLHQPYETLMVEGSPIYAEISENANLEEMKNRGK